VSIVPTKAGLVALSLIHWKWYKPIIMFHYLFDVNSGKYENWKVRESAENFRDSGAIFRYTSLPASRGEGRGTPSLNVRVVS
jgi:hypothetical protein